MLHGGKKQTVFNVTHGRLCKRSITEAMECGVSIVLLVKVKFTFYFGVSHHSNIIIYCQNIYTIEEKAGLYTCQIWKLDVVLPAVNECVSSELPYTRTYSPQEG